MNNRLINIFAFTVLTLLWLAFGAALLFQPAMLDSAWQAFLDWHWIVKLFAGLLTLPVVIGLWDWESSWPLLLRLALVAGLAWITLYTFFPKKTAAQPAPAVKPS
jgi:hypothetical protein